MKSVIREDTNKTALSLFSGAGGFDIGIQRAGFQILGAVEIDQHCCETLEHNIQRENRSTQVFCSDIRKIDATDMLAKLPLEVGSLDLLFGGPPCQSFSGIGKRQGVEDSRGQLIFEMVRFARVFKPKFVVMEQVTGFANFPGADGRKGGIKDELVKKFETLGYSISSMVLNAADYGVPQLRKRFFLVAHRKQYSFTFPNPTHTKSPDLIIKNYYKTVGDALSGIGPVLSNESEDNFNHIDITPARDRYKISFVTEGGNLANSEAPPEVKGKLTKKDTTKFRRLNANQPSNTLRCGETFYHPTENRYLTPRECMRIHSFPDDYILKGPIRGRSGQVKSLDQHRQVANSVPPELARLLGLSIYKCLS